MVSGEYSTVARSPSARLSRRKWRSRSGSAISRRGAVRNATEVWPSSASRRSGSSTAAALSGRTRQTPVMRAAEAFSATTGAPGRRSCHSRIDSPVPTGAMASPASRCAAISCRWRRSRSSE